MNKKSEASVDSYSRFAQEWESLMHAGKNLAHTYVEKPAMFSMLPENLQGKEVLCLGCGTGEECQYLKSQGAKVTGIDISPEMIKAAKENDRSSEIDFQVGDMSELSKVIGDKKYDFVYSSLAVHYVHDLGKMFQSVNQALNSDGIFLFSTHHPIKFAAESERSDSKKQFTMGYTEYADGSEPKIHGDYLNFRQIQDMFLGKFPVVFFHRPEEELRRSFRGAGFKEIDFREPKAIQDAESVAPDFYKIHQKIPLFEIYKLQKEKKA